MKYFFGIILSLFLLSQNNFALAQTNGNQMSYYRATVVSAESITKQGNGEFNSSFNDWQKVKIKLYFSASNYKEYDIENQSSVLEKNDRNLKPGDQIIVSYQEVNGEAKIAMEDFDRTWPIRTLALICLALVLVIGSIMGIRSLVGFSWIALVLIGWFIPRILAGDNVYWLAFVAALAIIIGMSLLVMGIKKEALLIMLSSMFGLVVASILTVTIGNWAHFSGLGQEVTSLFRLSPVLSKLDLLGIIYVSIMIGAVGSMMDMSISIVAGVDELIGTNRDKGVRKFTPGELFRSGLNIGRSVMAAETNTMILAYFGSALTIWLIAVSQNFQWSILISFNMIFGELLRILAGAAGIFSSIPMTAFLASRMLIYNRKFSYEKKDE